jgi:hypothetical protein
VLALAVHHPEPALASQQFWLVVCRRDHNLPPWYVLTRETIENADDLGSLVFAYSRRWLANRAEVARVQKRTGV